MRLLTAFAMTLSPSVIGLAPEQMWRSLSAKAIGAVLLSVRSLSYLSVHVLTQHAKIGYALLS